MSSCPKCKTHQLSPVLLSAGLSAKGCGSCKGVLVDLLSYRAWADYSGIDAIDSGLTGELKITEDTSEAMLCPNCSAVMSKYRMSSELNNKLDYCANCDAAWLDGGEWEQLANLGLRMNLGTVFSEPWQKRVREDVADKSRELRTQKRFGEDYTRIAEFRTWLLTHPNYEEILAWFRDRDS